jgi:anti-sigma regulatory factor (Ser/Thr protein kinase)
VRELSLHVLDILENALAAGATLIELEISESTAQNRLTIRVSDNGRGMDANTLRRVTDPFFTTRTTRQVGLGLPLLKAAAQRCNGDLTISSQPGVGTQVLAEFQRDHIDRAPLGDMKSTVLGLILAERPCDLSYEHRVDERSFCLDTRDLRCILGDVPLTHPQARAWLEEYLDQEPVELEATKKPSFS